VVDKKEKVEDRTFKVTDKNEKVKDTPFKVGDRILYLIKKSIKVERACSGSNT